MSQSIPLFPLKTVLFPRGCLPLRIFEPRYLDMISRCMKTGQGIGVVLIREGSEVGDAASTYDTGTLSEISYWHRRATIQAYSQDEWMTRASPAAPESVPGAP